MSKTDNESPLDTLLEILGAEAKTPQADTSDEGVAALLSHDPLQAMEDFTGKDVTTSLSAALAFVQTHGTRKEEVLIQRCDTTFTNKLDRYVGIITDYGFELAGKFPFKSRMWGYDELMFVYVHRGYGLILCFDTYGGADRDGGYYVNGGKVYYNWIPNADLNHWSCTSSGWFHFDDDVKTWVGDHDCREALIFQMERLRKNGTFLPKWRENPFLWFLHYDDTYEGYDYDATNRERISQMPLVQEIIQPYKGGLE